METQNGRVRVTLAIGSSFAKARSGQLIPDEPPSVFGVPQSCLPAPLPAERKYTSFVKRNQQPDEMDQFTNEDELDIQTAVSEIPKRIQNVACMMHNNELTVASHGRAGAPHNFSIFADANSHEYRSYYGIKSATVPFLCRTIGKYSELEVALHCLQTYEETDERVRSTNRQIDLSNVSTGQRYGSTDIAVALRLRACGAACFRKLREDVYLPSERTLRRFTKLANDVGEQDFFMVGYVDVPKSSRLCFLDLTQAT